MNTRIQKQTSKYTREHGFRKRWHEVLTVLAAVVVFFTTYALIMPAVTKTQDTFCGIEQHTHDDSCFGDALTCWIPEEAHEHSSDCYEEQELLVCGLSESEGHFHNEECFGEEGELICGEAESEGHWHDSGCCAMEEVLVCGQDEHGPHTHTASCYSPDKEHPICGKALHEHVLQCFSNPEADTEKAEQWERTVERVRFDGSYAYNLIAVARSQLGYTESESNYRVLEDGKSVDGYTRYGQWAGNPYEPWNIDFAAFCVTYAEVDLPVETDTVEWIKALGDAYSSAAGYKPVHGDLVFFDEDGDYRSERVGIVAEIAEDGEGEITFQTIEGDVKKRVDFVDNKLSEVRLLGYCRMPEDEESTQPTISLDPIEIGDDAVGGQLSDGFARTYEGRDYTVVVTWDESAEIPEEAVLVAAEYDRTSETYRKRFAEAAALNGWEETEEYKANFRLFNIGLFVDGVEIVPKSEIHVTITYQKRSAGRSEECQVIHYGQEPEALDASFDGNRIDFVTDSFSDFGVSLTPQTQYTTIQATEDALKPMISNTFSESNLIAHFSFDNNITDAKGNAQAAASGRYGFGWTYTVSGQSLNLTGNNLGTFLTLTKKDGSGLLEGYDQIAFDFWIRPNGRDRNAWAYYASNTTTRPGWGTQQYIGGFVEGNKTTFKTERYLSGSGSDAIVDMTRTGNWVHVCVEYKRNETRVKTMLYSGNQGGTYVSNSTRETTVTTSNSLLDILGSNAMFLIGTGNWNNDEYFNGYIDEFRIYARNSHPQTSATFETPVRGVALYNVNATMYGANSYDRKASPLAGVEYTVYDENGEVYGVYTTDDTYYMSIGALPPGNYSIEQTGVPDGYMVISQRKTFTVPDAFDTYVEAGIFYDYPFDRVYDPKKLASVSDYENRIYNIDFSAYSGDVKVSINKKNFNFVVDQSNSMLFPAVLTDTGKRIQLFSTNDGDSNTSNDAGGNSARMDALGLDPNQVYYIVTDSTGQATVCAMWKSSYDQKWYIQDASYYVFAQNGIGNDKYADEGGNGVCLNGSSETNGATVRAVNLPGDIDNYADGTTNRGYKYRYYTVYTGSEMNRLTYLKYAIKRMLYQIAAMGSENTVTITTFDKKVESCIERVIDVDHMDNLQQLVNFVDGINTSGGTAQHLGLWHVAGRQYSGFNNSGCTKNHLVSGESNYVVLITDGALNEGTHITGNNNKDDLRNAGAAITNDPLNRLITIGLSVDDVTLAQELLTDLPGGIATPGFSFLDIDADMLSVTLSNSLLSDVVEFTKTDCIVDFRDYISDSFYITDSKGNPLNAGQWIDPNGNPVTNSDDLYQLSRAFSLDGRRRNFRSNYREYGRIGKDENGWFVEWPEQILKVRQNFQFELANEIWKGRVYVKAKEDFIGGNAIDTNKTAGIHILEVDGNNEPLYDYDTKKHTDFGVIPLKSPNVNVHLLPMNMVESEQTVFLGDRISVLQQIKDLITQISFSKLSRPRNADDPDNSYGDAIYNYHDTAADAKADDGLEASTFSLAYAGVGIMREEDLLQDLIDADWDSLCGGAALKIPYIYDNVSSHGAVGQFEIRLIPQGDNAEIGDHEAREVGYGIEKYYLRITYTADRLEKSGGSRPDNVGNGTPGPGTEVGSVANQNLNQGYGVVLSDNLHRVNVVDGKVTIVKRIDEKLREDFDQQFSFQLMVQTDPGNAEEGTEPTYENLGKPIKVTVPAGELESDKVTVCELKRGTYMVVELTGSDDVYYPDSVEVIAATGCVEQLSDTTATFTIGNICRSNGGEDHSMDEDVIYWVDPDQSGYREVYSTLLGCVDEETGEASSMYRTDPHGVCFAEVEVMNKEIPKYAEIPVEKQWQSVSNSMIGDVYVVLYKDGVLQEDSDGNAQAIVLNEANGWTASFRVPLPNRKADVRKLGYSIRELSGVKPEIGGNLKPAMVTNIIPETEDGEEPEKVIVYYAGISEKGNIAVGDYAFHVDIELIDENGDYFYRVTNSMAYELPKTGGMGTTPLYIAGFLLMAVVCVYEFRPRRRSERRAR